MQLNEKRREASKIAENEISRRSNMAREFADACPDIRSFLRGKSFSAFCRVMVDIIDDNDFIYLNELYEAINE